tara:strand:+ start:141 stop:680 length:540 start_codon:yes stop_codon:yes gene_type:complete
MARNKKMAASSDFTSISSTVDIGERAEIEAFRGAPSQKYPEESFFLACRKTGTRGSFLKIDAEGLTDLRKWVNGSEFKDLLARVEASEAGRLPTVAAPSPGAGLESTDDRLAALVNAGFAEDAARAMLGLTAPTVQRAPHKTSKVDLVAELSHGDAVLEAVFGAMTHKQLVAAAIAARG